MSHSHSCPFWALLPQTSTDREKKVWTRSDSWWTDVRRRISLFLSLSPPFDTTFSLSLRFSHSLYPGMWPWRWRRKAPELLLEEKVHSERLLLQGLLKLFNHKSHHRVLTGEWCNLTTMFWVCFWVSSEMVMTRKHPASPPLEEQQLYLESLPGVWARLSQNTLQRKLTSFFNHTCFIKMLFFYGKCISYNTIKSFLTIYKPTWFVSRFQVQILNQEPVNVYVGTVHVTGKFNYNENNHWNNTF